MLNENERQERLTQLGASDVHKIFNFDNKGAIDLWKEKMGYIERKEISNHSLTAGNLLEEDCLYYFFNAIGEKDFTINERVEHKKIKNFVVSTDAIVNGIPVENKTMKYENYAKLLKPERTHYIQLHAQMSCLNAERGYLVYNAVDDDDLNNPLMYQPNTFKQEYYLIEAEQDLIDEIEKRAKYFLWCLEYKRQPSESHYLSMILGDVL